MGTMERAAMLAYCYLAVVAVAAAADDPDVSEAADASCSVVAAELAVALHSSVRTCPCCADFDEPPIIRIK